MHFVSEIRRLLAGMLVAFVLVGILAGIWAVLGPEWLLAREDNPRTQEARSRIDRGNIIDRDGTTLVETVIGADGQAERVYHYDAMHSALGYYSLRYGTGGAEAAYDTQLGGQPPLEDAETMFRQNLLHLPQQGDDVRLSFDLETQQAADRLMDGRTGGVAVISVPDGDLITMLSLPTYDPNTLEAQWEALTEAPGEPFFNRVLQGRYQPGGLTYYMLVTSMLIERYPQETTFTEADAAVSVADVTLNCIDSPPATTLTLFDAFVYGCPAPFAAYARDVGFDAVQDTFTLFRPDETPLLPGFRTQADETSPTPGTATTPDDGFGLSDALGQGDFRVSPLEVAAFGAAAINQGNAPEPRVLLGVKSQEAVTWTAAEAVPQENAITTVDSARSLQALLRQNVERGTASAAAQDGLDIGGQVALGYAGETTHAWFMGFVRMDALQGFAVAVLLENSDDLDEAARIGGAVLRAAMQQAVLETDSQDTS